MLQLGTDKAKKMVGEQAYIDAKARAINTETSFMELSRRMERKRAADLKVRRWPCCQFASFSRSDCVRLW